MTLLPKSLIPDANILFSFFKIDSMRRHIFRELLRKDVEFFNTEFVIEEILAEKDRIKRFSTID